MARTAVAPVFSDLIVLVGKDLGETAAFLGPFFVSMSALQALELCLDSFLDWYSCVKRNEYQATYLRGSLVALPVWDRFSDQVKVFLVKLFFFLPIGPTALLLFPAFAVF